MMQRAMELKQDKNLCKGTISSMNTTSESSDSFITRAKAVNISLGANSEMINNNVDLILNRDLAGRKEFLGKNLEINLPSDLDIDISMQNFPSLVNQTNTSISSPLKEVDGVLEKSWAKETSKGLKPSSSTNVNNDRCNLEC